MAQSVSGYEISRYSVLLSVPRNMRTSWQSLATLKTDRNQNLLSIYVVIYLYCMAKVGAFDGCDEK